MITERGGQVSLCPPVTTITGSGSEILPGGLVSHILAL
jgi:hypothetical protein